ncbi:alpha/beta hydrolase [Ferdinandcohnia quinoae]|uniref:Lysophospholipase n=1 Tax=Fredinandcohnia quinoae TaxID=2918902 RepID=A0AAW5DUM9_9BACI|nr:alpha/beta hydrolase [Fredinandcohnia sp. SECRCQ15]MCH1624068.1 lysophospholipase [Fredinandcohnia sp. SECRCQ15]
MDTQESFTYQTDDDIEIYVRKWIAEEKPRAIVQIAHGMAEHIERYDEFAKVLVSKGIYVFGNDHRGHGKTAELNKVSGYFSDEQGFEKVANDMYTLTSMIEKEYPDVPIFLFGHSMGSFLTRRYIQLHGSRLTGAIICGTGGDPGFIGKIGRLIARREAKKHGRITPSPKLNNLVFGNYNKVFRPNRTEFDWLSRDKHEVDKYVEDPSCGGIFTTGFFNDLLEGLAVINDPKNLQLTPTDLPLFFISGSTDPVGNHTKGVLQAYQAYKRVGMKDISYKFYEGARHELLNETNKEEVYVDVIKWIQSHLEGAF